MQLCRALCLSALADADDVDSSRSYSKTSNIETRPKTPTSSNIENRPKTPSQNRPKTPTLSHNYGVHQDPRNRPAQASRPFPQDGESNRLPQENHVSKFSNDIFGDHRHQHGEYDHSRADLVNHMDSFYERARPPPGPRMDPLRQNDVRLDTRGRLDYRDGYGYSRPNQGGGSGDGDKYGYGYMRDVKPGQFRSRTPGPELMARGGHGSDHRSETHRPKTPTAQDMRSKTPMPTSHNYGGPDLRASGRHTPNPNTEFGRGHNRADYSRGWPDFSSPPVGRRYDSFENPAHNRSYGGELARTMPSSVATFGQNSPRGAGHPVRQSTSFETEEPTPGNMTRLPRRPPFATGYPQQPGSASQSPRSQSRGPVDHEVEGFMEFTVQLHRQESGYGFRIIGGTEEGSQVSVIILYVWHVFERSILIVEYVLLLYYII